MSVLGCFFREADEIRLWGFGKIFLINFWEISWKKEQPGKKMAETAPKSLFSGV